MPNAGPLRAPVAGLRGRLLCGRGAAHTRLRPVRPRVLGEDGGLLESNPTATRHAHLPRRLPLLRVAAEWRARRLHQTHLPRSSGLETDRTGPNWDRRGRENLIERKEKTKKLKQKQKAVFSLLLNVLSLSLVFK